MDEHRQQIKVVDEGLAFSGLRLADLLNEVFRAPVANPSRKANDSFRPVDRAPAGAEMFLWPVALQSGQFSHKRHIEFRVVLLHVLRPVLFAELLNHRFDGFGVSDGDGLKLCLRAPRINPNRRVVEHVLVPLLVRTLHWQQIKLPSSTNQTGMEIVRPDFLPITLSLIWQQRERWAFISFSFILIAPCFFNISVVFSDRASTVCPRPVIVVARTNPDFK